jgi:hypothetical protein
MNASKVLLMVAFVVSIMANAYILYHLYKLEQDGCQCAINWRRTFIIAILLLNFGLLAFSLLHVNPPHILHILAFVGSIANVVIMLQYVNLLEEESCKCSDPMSRTIMRVVAIFQAAIFVVTAMLPLLSTAFGLHIFSNDEVPEVLQTISDPFNNGSLDEISSMVRESVRTASDVKDRVFDGARKSASQIARSASQVARSSSNVVSRLSARRD